MSDEKTPDPRCESCFYWRWFYHPSNTSTTWHTKCCHYCIDNRLSRARDGDRCASYLHKSKRRADRVFNPDLEKLREGRTKANKWLKIVSPRRGWTSY